MAKTLKEAPITTASARNDLPVGEYARRLDGDVDASIWYRRSKRGGVWFTRWRNPAKRQPGGVGANYLQAPVGSANDVNDKPTEGLLTFAQAAVQARKIVALARQEQKAAADGPVITVRVAVETYINDRDARDTRRKGRAVHSDAGQRLRRYVLGQAKRGKQDALPAAALAAVALHALKENDLLEWRKGLPAELKGSTEQRLINDLKAALNGAYASHRTKLDPTLPSIIKHGLKAEKTDDDDAVPLARENQILSTIQVGAILAAAREVDAEDNWEGDLFRFVMVMARTGARFSQIARMKVGDVQRSERRLMIPSSRKGRRSSNKVASVACPLEMEELNALLPATKGRGNDEFLLERWRSKQVPGSIGWERAGRGPWQFASELQRPWQDIRKRAGMPDVIPYALRHSSIVRDIKKNLPIRIVASRHDTSTVMIERHYTKHIVEGADEMVRAAMEPLLPDDTGTRIVKLRGA